MCHFPAAQHVGGPLIITDRQLKLIVDSKRHTPDWAATDISDDLSATQGITPVPFGGQGG